MVHGGLGSLVMVLAGGRMVVECGGGESGGRWETGDEGRGVEGYDGEGRVERREKETRRLFCWGRKRSLVETLVEEERV